MPNHARNILDFYSALAIDAALPAAVETLRPMDDASVMKTMSKFFLKYFSDSNTRNIILGINPGRFGAGVTGINFTASKQLSENCGIEHSFPMQSELSAEFIYEVIEAFGGAAEFYSRFFLSSVSPLGFVSKGKNLNYYDDRLLERAITPFIESCIEQQLRWNINRQTCICIGGEKNYKFLSSLNERHQWFGDIRPLPHPRFIMQYRRKQKDVFIRQYIDVLSSV